MASCVNNVCSPTARCVENAYGVSCICPPLFTGNGYGPNGCTQLNFTNDVCASHPCQNGGQCVNIGVSTFRCICPPGTLLPMCALPNQNPCAMNPCRNGGTCAVINALRYQCTCTRSFTGVNCQTETRACGGVINSLSGSLKYPLSDSYPHNSRCAWLIRTNDTKVLNVTFTKFNLENSRECRFDWLQVRSWIKMLVYFSVFSLK